MYDVHVYFKVLDGVEKDTGYLLPELKVDGGMTVNNLLLQTQANFLNKTVGKKT
jgi:glycerol kinase